MKQSDGKLRLKIKKKDTSASSKKVTNNSNSSVQGQKRSNPFSQGNLKKIQQTDDYTYHEKSALLDKLTSLSSINNRKSLNDDCGHENKNKDGSNSDVGENDETNEDNVEEIIESKYCSPLFPLDWGVKQKFQLISTEPLSICADIKSAEKAAGISIFASNENETTNYYQYLCNWIHPLIPGINNFPLKRSFSIMPANNVKEESGSMNIGGNHSFLAALLQQWKISFQSLFNMLKSGHCPYFYICTHQFSVLFKGAAIGCKNVNIILTPTTKGLRSMLSDEGILFEFIYKDELSVTESSNDKTTNDKNTTGVEFSNSDADSYLDSLGLNVDKHFPNMEEQRRLSVKSKLRLLDNRPDSTIEISNYQGFFNFLLNSQLLCATSGSMAGIPPTLISPTPFEGGALNINKYTYGKVKQHSSSSKFMYCLDINGFIIPTQLKGIVDLQTQSSSNNFHIHTKGYENLFAFNSNTTTVKSEDLNSQYSFLNQLPQSIPDQGEVKFINNLFKF